MQGNCFNSFSQRARCEPKVFGLKQCNNFSACVAAGCCCPFKISYTGPAHFPLLSASRLSVQVAVWHLLQFILNFRDVYRLWIDTTDPNLNTCCDLERKFVPVLAWSCWSLYFFSSFITGTEILQQSASSFYVWFLCVLYVRPTVLSTLLIALLLCSRNTCRSYCTFSSFGLEDGRPDRPKSLAEVCLLLMASSGQTLKAFCKSQKLL